MIQFHKFDEIDAAIRSASHLHAAVIELHIAASRSRLDGREQQHCAMTLALSDAQSDAAFDCLAYLMAVCRRVELFESRFVDVEHVAVVCRQSHVRV